MGGVLVGWSELSALADLDDKEQAMYPFTSDPVIAGKIAHQQIDQRIRDAEAHRMARSAMRRAPHRADRRASVRNWWIRVTRRAVA